jgi:hypothetical protein
MHEKDRYQYCLWVWYGGKRRCLRTRGGRDRIDRLMSDRRIMRALRNMKVTTWELRQEAVRHVA